MKLFNENKKIRKNTPETSETAADDSESPAFSRILVHRGPLAKTLSLLPAVATNTFSSGWNYSKLRALKQAIQRLVVQNPILSGSVVMEKDSIYVEPGMHNPDTHMFWTDITSYRDSRLAADPRTILFLEDYIVPNLHTMPAKQKLRFMQNHVAPLFPEVTRVKEEAKKRLPVFHVYLLPLTGGNLAYSIRMSHAVGDAATYFALVNQLSHLLQGNGASPAIDWEAPARRMQEGHSKSEVDAMRLQGTPLRLNKRSKQQGYLVLSRPKIQRRQQQLRAGDVGYPTTNNVVVAALCQSNPKLKSFCLIVNGRDTRKEQQEELVEGGNNLRAISFPRGAAVDPSSLCRMARDGLQSEATNHRCARISNWSDLSQSLEVEGVTTHVQVLPEDFVKSLPLDTAVMFSMDDKHIGVLHNFKSLDVTENQLKRILA